MVKRVLPGLVFIALAAFALPAAAQNQNSNRSTPATDTQCDTLATATPGLQGLCVALCEAAPGCEGKLDPVTGEVGFNASCNASAGQILANYNKKKKANDPPMPCVELACACWSEPGIDNIGGGTGDRCYDRPDVGFAGLSGKSADTGRFEAAYAFKNGCYSSESASKTAPSTVRQNYSLSDQEAAVCRKSVIEECESRPVPFE